VTLLREPTARYLSEWKQVQRGSTWQSAQLVCDGRPATLDEVPFCFQGTPQILITSERQQFLPRDAMHARYQPWACVCLSVSVTSRSSSETAKHRITKTKPHDSSGSLVFFGAKDLREIRPESPPAGTPNAGGVGSKSENLENGAWFLLKSNRKSYALYRMVTLRMTLSDL